MASTKRKEVKKKEKGEFVCACVCGLLTFFNFHSELGGVGVCV
jgi:hypothetical protein